MRWASEPMFTDTPALVWIYKNNKQSRQLTGSSHWICKKIKNESHHMTCLNKICVNVSTICDESIVAEKKLTMS